MACSAAVPSPPDWCCFVISRVRVVRPPPHSLLQPCAAIPPSGSPQFVHVVYSQLTGRQFSADATDDEQRQLLKQALAGQLVLLVVDDAWAREDIAAVAFVDEDTASRVRMGLLLPAWPNFAHSLLTSPPRPPPPI